MSDESAAQSPGRQFRLEQVLADYLHSVENGQPLDRSALVAAHPDLADDLHSFFRNRDSIDRLAEPLKAAAEAPTIAGPSNIGAAAAGNTVRYFGDYELLTEIARGGMGVVYKARQVNLNRIVALKMILTGQLANDSDVKRFYAEAEAAARLDHPGIVPIFEIGQHEGQHYFSMAFIEGESLAKKVADGPLPPREAAEFVKTISAAVQYAHEKGIIHRDLKPANVLLDQTGQPRVTDFGLAKHLQGDSGLTGTGQILGTPSYMPPEQAAGKVDQIGPQSDVYALGAILYCLLTGRPPFQAASPMDTLVQVLDQEPVSVRRLNPQVPLDLETIALKCLEKEPARRFANAADLVDELGRYLRGEPILARPVGPFERTSRWCKRNRAVAALTAAVAVVLVAGTVISTSLGLVANWNAQVAAQNAQAADRERNRANAKADEASAEARRANENAEKARQEAERATRLAGELEQSLAAESEAREAADDQADNARRAAAQEAEARQATRRSLYAAHMNLAWQAWDEGNLARVDDVLEAHKPHADDEDLRGFEWYHLWSLTHRYQISIAGEFSSDSSMWLDSKSRTLALRSALTSFTLWNLDSRQVQARCPVSNVRHTSAQRLGMRPAVSPDMTTAAIPWQGNALQLWNLVSDKAGRELLHDQPVLAVAYAPDGKTVVAGSEAATLIAWDTDDGRRLWTRTIVNTAGAAPATELGIRQVSFSPDGTRLATIGLNSAHLWDAKTGEPQGALTRRLNHSGIFGTPLQFTADGKFVVISDVSVNVLIWNVDTLEERVVDRVLGESFGAFAIAPDSSTLVTGGVTLRIRDLATGKERASLPGTKDRISAMAFTPDSRLLAVATNRGTIRLHDIESGEIRRTLHGHKGRVEELAFTNDGGTLVSRSTDGTVKVWDLNDQRRPPLLQGHSAAVESLAFGPAGELVSVDAAGVLKRWDVRGGTELSSRQLAIDLSRFGILLHAELSSDGQSVALCTHNQTGHVLDCTTGNERFRFTARLGLSKDRDFSRDGRLFAANEGQRARVWETDSGQVRAEIPAPLGGFTCLVFLPDGNRLATADSFVGGRVWNIADRKPQKTIWTARGAGAQFFPTLLSSSPDGRILAAGAMSPMGEKGSTVKLWDLVSGKEIAALKGDQMGVANLVFSPDSKTLVSSTIESPPRLNLWSVVVHEQVATLHGVSTASQSSGPRISPAIAFSRDGRLLAHGNSDGTIELFWGEVEE